MPTCLAYIDTNTVTLKLCQDPRDGGKVDFWQIFGGLVVGSFLLCLRQRVDGRVYLSIDPIQLFLWWKANSHNSDLTFCSLGFLRKLKIKLYFSEHPGRLSIFLIFWFLKLSLQLWFVYWSRKIPAKKQSAVFLPNIWKR